jgi:uncharacterized membrane protein
VRLAYDRRAQEELLRLWRALLAVRGRAERARLRRRRRLLIGSAAGVGVTGGAIVALGRAGRGGVIEESVEVEAPVRAVYDQWTQFEEFPRFMEGIEEVRQLDDAHLRWVASIGGARREWEAEISEQRPDERVAWHSRGGKPNGGVVTFHRLADDRSKVMVQLEFEPQGLRERVGHAVGADERRVRRDLQAFKRLVEADGRQSGGWRGEIDHGTVTTPDPGEGAAADRKGSSGAA